MSRNPVIEHIPPKPGRSARDVPSEALIRMVGERVRRARESQRIPRRVLSEMSGVSPRYLAQLEAGEGNISIGLLHRVASALGVPIDRLLAGNPSLSTEALRVAELYQSAEPGIRRRVDAFLEAIGATDARAGRICLIGLRGAGKSTLGTLAGAALGIPFVELNREIEEATGMPVGEVLALYGQEGYRRLEDQALTAVSDSHGAFVLAVAGGIVGSPETYATLLDRFHTIWLRAAPDEHMARVRAQGDTRPMAGNPGAMDQLRTILQAREEQYARAEAQLDTSGRTVEQSRGDLLALIETRGFLGTK